jgi:hypothetical protein
MNMIERSESTLEPRNNIDKQAEQVILKVEVEKVLCDCFEPFLDKKGYDVIASLMATDTHVVNKYIGDVLRTFDYEFDLKRPEDWSAFSKKVSHDVSYENADNLSPKAKCLRKASYILALLADSFDYIEKSELKSKKD